jgi:hypothetical protein
MALFFQNTAHIAHIYTCTFLHQKNIYVCTLDLENNKFTMHASLPIMSTFLITTHQINQKFLVLIY